MLRLGGELLDTGVKVFDICMWRSENGDGSQIQLQRVAREVHYPPDAVDVLQPFVLLCHQGMVEGTFVEDLRQSGIEVQRASKFDTLRYRSADGSGLVEASFKNHDADITVHTDYLVGCDGARSRVRQCIPDAYAQGNSQESYWGVLDGELKTGFPDIWLVFPQTSDPLVISHSVSQE